MLQGRSFNPASEPASLNNNLKDPRAATYTRPDTYNRMAPRPHLHGQATDGSDKADIKYREGDPANLLEGSVDNKREDYATLRSAGEVTEDSTQLYGGGLDTVRVRD
ncbi:hypothetical protein VTL71DRAFT_10838 [Oculimacula yallundae]|uniref:Uncharacterized protein n=1 Tax=Oculimacula yallundae TaxID=86028 RepID=A0ABR4CUK8_9HELO